ncbi:hypothetical protein [Gorillibacterium sp. CAU 1737]|uniref:hypothetical protein n=1 Tax=Gorillibacterium sp. CAU 1737 TaxID=3140362 RepID=UPI0032603688
MIALIHYLLRDFSRSHRYLAPLLLGVGFITWMYSLVPNPVMESYIFTSTFLYGITAWLTLNFLRSEAPVQRELSALHVGSRIRYEWGRLLSAALFAFFLSLFATFYPALRGAFDHVPNLSELLLGLVAHLSVTWLMIVLVWMVEGDGTRPYPNVLFVLILLLVLSIGGQGIGNKLPDSISWVIGVLPPVFRVNKALYQAESHLSIQVWGGLMLPIVYSLIPLFYGFTRFRKRSR